MSKFKLVNIRDEKELSKYYNNTFWIQSDLLAYYREGYICFSRKEDYSFKELINMFFRGNDDDQIGAISIIAERYPNELYQLLCDQRSDFSTKKLKYIFEVVLPSYLPLILPKDRLIDYEFGKEFLNDIWVNILVEIRSILQL